MRSEQKPHAEQTLAFTEPVYGDAGLTAFTGSTLAGLLDLREDDEDGADIPFTASIDDQERTVTIAPRGALPATTWVQVKDTYYDAAGNRGQAATAVFHADTAEPTTPRRDVDRVLPRIRSLVRQTPAARWTNADSLTWRITFSEAVIDVDESDFAVFGIEPCA